MPTLRDLLPGPAPTMDSLLPQATPAASLRTINYGPDVQAASDQEAANGMGQLRRGFTTGRLNTESNYLLAEESRLRAANRLAEADDLRARATALQARGALFAPTEQDVTALQWNPGRILDYGLGAMGQGAASMVDPVALGVGANAAGGLIGMVPHPTAQVASKGLRLAGLAGGYGLNALQGKGEFYGEATQNPEIMRTKSAQEIDTAGNVSGAVSGALDTVLTGSVAGRIAGRPGTKALAGLGTLPKVGLDVAGEAATETAQGEVKRGTLGYLDPTRDTSGDANARWNDAAGGAFGAAPMSLASHMASKGHARLAVPDDTSSDDVSGKAKPGAAPKNETMSQAVLRRAKHHDDEAAAEAWNDALAGTNMEDVMSGTAAQHAALIKELSGRAEKGDATAAQHLGVLQGMDPENITDEPGGWLDTAPRDAAYQHLMGDGKDHEKVRAAYRGRKLNEQGEDDPHTALVTGLLKAALPADARGLDAAAADLGADLGALAKAPKGKVSIANAGRMWDTAERAVRLYGFEGAKAAIAKVGMALGVEKTEMFKTLQSQLAGADYRQAKQGRRATRVEAAQKLFAATPAEARLKMFGDGVDLTTTSHQLALLDYVEQTAKAIGWGAVDNKGKPIEVKPSAYAKLTSRLGGDAARAALDLVSPGKVEEREDVGMPKKSGGEKTGPAKESDNLDNGLSDDLESDDWGLDGALKNIERAPGTSMYLFKGRQAVGSTEGAHPFVKNKAGNLPTLSRADETNDGEGPKGSGPNTLDHMMGKAYEALGGGFKNIRKTITETMAGPLRPGEARRTRRTTTESDPMMELASANKGALGVGSSRIRRVSATEVMKHHGLAPAKRIELMREYLARPRKGDDGKEMPPLLAKDDPTIRQIQVLDRAIKARESTTPKLVSTLEGTEAVGQTRVRLKKTDNPEYVRLRELQGQRKEAFAALAAKIGVDVAEDASIADLADAYFGDRFLVVAEQMAEKDGLRLSPAEVRKLIKRGADDLDYSDQFKKDGLQEQVQADMNLIRFKSKHAISKDGIAAIRAGELVKWVFENRTTFNKKDYGGEDLRAHEFRDALMEGIGALAADGYMDELPFMVNEKGETESFEKGFPPSLKLSGLTQAALDVRKAERVAKVEPFVGPPDVDAVAREQDGGAKSPDAAVARDEARTERLPAESDGAPDEYRHQGTERGAADRKVDTPLPAERFWDSPELTSTRTDENRVPSQAEPRTQKKGVPTDRTELSQRNAVLDANVDEVRPLTMSNAMRKAEDVAEQLMAGLMRAMKPTWVDKAGKPVPTGSPMAHKLITSDAKTDPAAGWERIKNMARAMVSAKQYAAPLAYVFTPKNIDAMVKSAKDPAAARPMLLRMQSAVANTLTKMDEGGFTIADRTKLARLLTGNEKLPAPRAAAALEALSWTERKAAKAEREAAKPALAEPAKPMVAKPEPTPTKPAPDKQVAWVAKHLAASVMAFRKAIKDFTFEQLDKVRLAIIDLDDSSDHHGVEAVRWSWALSHVESQMNEKEPAAAPKAKVADVSEQAHALMAEMKHLWSAEAFDDQGHSSYNTGIDAFLQDAEEDSFAFDRKTGAPNMAVYKKFMATVEKRRPDLKAFAQAHWDRSAAQVEHGVRADAFFLKNREALANHPDAMKNFAGDIKRIGQIQARGNEGKVWGIHADLMQQMFERRGDDAWRNAQIADKEKRLARYMAQSGSATGETGFMGIIKKEIALLKANDLRGMIASAAKFREPNDFRRSNYPGFPEPNLDAVSAADTGSRYNEQSTDNAARSDDDIAKAHAYLKKVLGPKAVVEFSKDFKHAGEWVSAENLIRLSTATGQGVLTVAYHEALHAFWTGAIKNHPGATEALSKVMSSPAMLARLEGLLAEHPAALKAITTGPHAAEERVAYAYQFWAAGELEVDKPATTMFAKFRKFLRKVLGMVRESETALDLMTALHEGKLAEPSAAGQVIGKIMKNATWNEDFKRKHDKFFQNAAAAISPSNDVLRHEKLSATARALGATMFTNPGAEGDGGKGEGYLNARTRKIRQYTNYLYAALKGLNEKDMEAAAKYLQLKTDPAKIPYAPVRKAVQDVRALTKRYYEYATKDAGMTLEYLGDDHYPRVWSLNTLIEEGGKDKFIAMLLKPKYAKAMGAAMEMANENRSVKLTLPEVAQAMYQHLIDKNGVDDKGLDAEMGGDESVLTPFFASQKERSFKWLDDADVEPFLEKDLVGAMSRYLHQGIRSAEYARRFGEGGTKLKEMLAMKGDEWINPETDRREARPEHGAIAAEIVASLKAQGVTGKDADVVLARHMEDIRRSVSAHEGSLGKDITPTARKWSSAAMAYQNLRLLPLSLFAAFGDVMGIVAHGAGAKAGYDAFLQGLKDVYLRWKDAASDMPEARKKSVWEGIAEMVGAIDSHMFLEQMGKAHTSEFMTDFARKSNRALFMANGLTAWDRSMRVSATKAAVLFLQDHASLPDRQHSKRWLAELGLGPKDIPLDADGKLITDRHVLAASRLKGGESDAEKSANLERATKDMERVHHALVRWVEGAVLTPNAGQRPTWASDPHYAVLFHLKQFTYSFHHTILKRAFNEASHGNMNPFGALAAAVPTMIAADMVKGLVVGGGSLPDYMKAWDAGDWVKHGLVRMGAAGTYQFGLDALSDPLGLMGPTVDQASDFITSPTDILHNIHNAIPGVRYIKGLPDLTRATA